MSDTLRTSRFKVFCPRCEEVYIPKTREVNLDGAFFGTSFPHAFLKHYPLAVILPPKVHFYEPKISGFKIAGKRGSKYYDPPRGATKFIKDSMQANLLEDTEKDPKEIEMRSLAADMSKLAISPPERQGKGEPVEEDKEAQVMEGGRKGGRKKNKNKDRN